MADATNGFHFDELSKIRLLEPDVFQQTQELKEECKEFVDKISEFQSIVGNFISMVDGLAKEVENEKMKAIGSRNLLKSVEKQRETEQEQLRALIAEKKVQLERHRHQYESLLKTEEDQREFLEQFILYK
ncbi:intraflagellar transport protein 20 homolog [Xenia sp. Carnegie-2017]|uniref:intraflagellar transport protein 20 homolog n=1 Tax=Xenia sp. Carnegie-2017 TaxID=2897299 RepID=UPI001F046AFE|nr:intraflagellar transport protein 20 homolog [Xenia sp. Carnegie-2017]